MKERNTGKGQKIQIKETKRPQQNEESIMGWLITSAQILALEYI